MFSSGLMHIIQTARCSDKKRLRRLGNFMKVSLGSTKLPYGPVGPVSGVGSAAAGSRRASQPCPILVVGIHIHWFAYPVVCCV